MPFAPFLLSPTQVWEFDDNPISQHLVISSSIQLLSTSSFVGELGTRWLVHHNISGPEITGSAPTGSTSGSLPLVTQGQIFPSALYIRI
jgi:hypothetical protein